MPPCDPFPRFVEYIPISFADLSGFLAVTWEGVDFSMARKEGVWVLAFALIIWLMNYLIPALILTKGVDWAMHRRSETGRRAIV